MHNNEKEKFITFITGGLYPYVTGGAEIFNYYLIKEVSKTRKIVLISNDEPCIVGLKFYKLKQLKPVRLFYPFQLFFLLCRSSYNSSAIYTSFMRASWLIYFPITIFSLFFKVPYSFTIHGGGLTEWNFKLPYIYFFRRANKITGVSHRICDEYKKRTGINIIYIPPLIPFATTNHSKHFLRSKYNVPLDKKVILFVGSLKPLKNPLDILKALNVLGKEYLEQKKIILIYAGDGVLKGDILKYSNENGLLEYVHLLGKVPMEFIHEIYSIADFYIISSRFEGTPIALLEAMFNSLPILASDSPGINNLLKHNKSAILFNTGDCTDLANGLKQLLADPVKENLIKTNANIYFNEHFDYHKIIDEYVKIIDL